MIASALTLVATLASLLVWWLQRRFARTDSPEGLYETQEQQINAAIADRAEGMDSINRLVERGVALRLRPSESTGAGDSVRSSDSISPGGQPPDESSRPLSGASGTDAGNPEGSVHARTAGVPTREAAVRRRDPGNLEPQAPEPRVTARLASSTGLNP